MCGGPNVWFCWFSRMHKFPPEGESRCCKRCACDWSRFRHHRSYHQHQRTLASLAYSLTVSWAKCNCPTDKDTVSVTARQRGCQRVGRKSAPRVCTLPELSTQDDQIQPQQPLSHLDRERMPTRLHSASTRVDTPCTGELSFAAQSLKVCADSREWMQEDLDLTALT